MKPKRLVREWKRATGKYLGQVQSLVRACRGRATAEPVHELRVVLRRLRLLLRVGRPLVGAAPVNAFLDWSRRVSDAAGPLRDNDVALEWLLDRTGAESLAVGIGRRRGQSEPAFRRRVRPMPLAIRGAVRRVRSDAETGALLRRRFVKRVAGLRKVVEEGAPRFFRLNVESQHEFRRRVRQWRYLREVDSAAGHEPGDPSLKKLLRLQEAIGEFQNLKIVESMLPAIRTTKGRALRHALLKDQARWHERIQKRLGVARQGLARR